MRKYLRYIIDPENLSGYLDTDVKVRYHNVEENEISQKSRMFTLSFSKDGNMYTILVLCPPDYPLKEPEINIEKNGNYVNIPMYDYTPAMKISQLITSIYFTFVM
jgi:ubiquitin-protein ligase